MTEPTLEEQLHKYQSFLDHNLYGAYERADLSCRRCQDRLQTYEDLRVSIQKLQQVLARLAHLA